MKFNPPCKSLNTFNCDYFRKPEARSKRIYYCYFNWIICIIEVYNYQGISINLKHIIHK